MRRMRGVSYRHVVDVATAERKPGTRDEQRPRAERPVCIVDVRVEGAVLHEADRLLRRHLVIRIGVLGPGGMVELHQRHRGRPEQNGMPIHAGR